MAFILSHQATPSLKVSPIGHYDIVYQIVRLVYL